MKDAKVNYALEMDGRFYIIEIFPTSVCEETGEHRLRD